MNRTDSTDRKEYLRNYMRDYMRKLRAKPASQPKAQDRYCARCGEYKTLKRFPKSYTICRECCALLRRLGEPLRVSAQNRIQEQQQVPAQPLPQPQSQPMPQPQSQSPFAAGTAQEARQAVAQNSFSSGTVENQQWQRYAEIYQDVIGKPMPAIKSPKLAENLRNLAPYGDELIRQGITNAKDRVLSGSLKNYPPHMFLADYQLDSATEYDWSHLTSDSDHRYVANLWSKRQLFDWFLWRQRDSYQIGRDYAKLLKDFSIQIDQLMNTYRLTSGRDIMMHLSSLIDSAQQRQQVVLVKSICNDVTLRPRRETHFQFGSITKEAVVKRLADVWNKASRDHDVACLCDEIGIFNVASVIDGVTPKPETIAWLVQVHRAEFAKDHTTDINIKIKFPAL